MGEDWDHIFVGISIKVMNFVPPVQDIRHRIWWWSIGDS
jgi:hypothetical protein